MVRTGETKTTTTTNTTTATRLASHALRQLASPPHGMGHSAERCAQAARVASLQGRGEAGSPPLQEGGDGNITTTVRQTLSSGTGQRAQMSQSCSAQAAVSFHRKGYYRPGREAVGIAALLLCLCLPVDSATAACGRIEAGRVSGHAVMNGHIDEESRDPR